MSKTLIKLTVIIALLTTLTTTARGQKATIVEEQLVFKTYPYSDPNPVPNPGQPRPSSTKMRHTHLSRKP